MSSPSLSKLIIIEAIGHTLGRYPSIIIGYLFGSYAADDAGPLSDVDVALYFDVTTQREDREKTEGGVRDDLEHALHLPNKVDVVVLNEELAPALERAIVYDGEAVYVKNDDVRAGYEARVICRWLDYKPHHDRLMADILAS